MSVTVRVYWEASTNASFRGEWEIDFETFEEAQQFVESGVEVQDYAIEACGFGCGAEIIAEA